MKLEIAKQMAQTIANRKRMNYSVVRNEWNGHFVVVRGNWPEAWFTAYPSVVS
jgi:hypothetical protein